MKLSVQICSMIRFPLAVCALFGNGFVFSLAKKDGDGLQGGEQYGSFPLLQVQPSGLQDPQQEMVQEMVSTTIKDHQVNQGLMSASPTEEPKLTAAEHSSPNMAKCSCPSEQHNESAHNATHLNHTAVESCHISKVSVRQDHYSNSGLQLADVVALYGGTSALRAQPGTAALAEVSSTSFACLDDRITSPVLATPGGDLGEFIIALSAYLQGRDMDGDNSPTQDLVDVLLAKYLETIPATRPMVHCTDQRAISRLETALPFENLDLTAPADQAKRIGLLQRLTEVESHGDTHIRLMLKQPEWFQLGENLVPMVLKSFYRLLWQQNQDPNSLFYKSGKLQLLVLSGQSNPQAFFEISSGELCQSLGVAPALVPRQGDRSVLTSHLDAVSLRRRELAYFFSRESNVTPKKLNAHQFHQRLDRHGWLALETTGSHIAAGLPFYTLNFS